MTLMRLRRRAWHRRCAAAAWAGRAEERPAKRGAGAARRRIRALHRVRLWLPPGHRAALPRRRRAGARPGRAGRRRAGELSALRRARSSAELRLVAARADRAAAAYTPCGAGSSQPGPSGCWPSASPASRAWTPAAASARETTELEIARRMQLSLLPELPPVMPDLDIAALVLPAAEIGGDFVGYFPRGADPEAAVQRQLGIAVGDISGKGLGAALLLERHGRRAEHRRRRRRRARTGGRGAARGDAALHQPQPHDDRVLLHAADPAGRRLVAARHRRRRDPAAAAPRRSGEIVWLETAGFPLGRFAGAQLPRGRRPCWRRAICCCC